MDRVMSEMLNNFGELPEDIKKIDTSLDNISNEEMTENLERLHTDRYFKMMDSLDTLSEDAEIMKLEKELHRRSVDETIARENDNVYEVIWKDSQAKIDGKQRFYALDDKEAILRAKHESRYGSDYKVKLIGKSSEFKLVSKKLIDEAISSEVKAKIDSLVDTIDLDDFQRSVKKIFSDLDEEDFDKGDIQAYLLDKFNIAIKNIRKELRGNVEERINIIKQICKNEGKVPDVTKDNQETVIKKLIEQGPEKSLVNNLLSGSGRLYEEDYTEKPDFDADEEAVVDEPAEEPVAHTEEEAPEAKKDEAPELKKEYVGKTEDTHYYIIANETDEGQAEDLQIVDQGGIKKYSAKENNLDTADVVGFIIKAIEEVDIAQIERGIFMKYILPKLTEEEKPEVEEEPAGTEEEEVKAEEPEEEEEVEESKVIKEDNKDLLDKVDHALNDLEDDMIHILWKKYVEQEQELDIDLLKEQLVNVAEADEDVLKEIAKDLGINESKVNEVKVKLEDISTDELKKLVTDGEALIKKAEDVQLPVAGIEGVKHIVKVVKSELDKREKDNKTKEGKVPDVTKDNQETVIKKLTEEDVEECEKSDKKKRIKKEKAKTKEESKTNEQNIAMRIPGQYRVTFYDASYEDINALSRVDAMAKAREKSPEKRISNVELLKSIGKSYQIIVPNTEGKVPDVTKDNPEIVIKKLLEMEVSDNENTFDIYLVDDGTMDTVINVNGREFRFDADFAGFWRDEDGEMSEEGLKELALDALSNLEEDEYSELLVSGKDVEASEETEEDELKKEPFNPVAHDKAMKKSSLENFDVLDDEKSVGEKKGSKIDDVVFDGKQMINSRNDDLGLIMNNLVELNKDKNLSKEEWGEVKSQLEEVIDSLDEKKATPKCAKCKKNHWPFQKCGAGKKKEKKESIEDIKVGAGEDEERYKEELPIKLNIPKEVMIDHNAGNVTAVADYLSDEYNFCVSDLKVKQNADGTGVVYNIVWDTSESKVKEGSGDDVHFSKGVYEIEYELNGKKEIMRVMALDLADAKKMVPGDPEAKVLNVKKVAEEGKVPDVTKDNQETVIKKLTEENKMDKSKIKEGKLPKNIAMKYDWLLPVDEYELIKSRDKDEPDVLVAVLYSSTVGENTLALMFGTPGYKDWNYEGYIEDSDVLKKLYKKLVSVVKQSVNNKWDNDEFLGWMRDNDFKSVFERKIKEDHGLSPSAKLVYVLQYHFPNLTNEQAWDIVDKDAKTEGRYVVVVYKGEEYSTKQYSTKLAHWVYDRENGKYTGRTEESKLTEENKMDKNKIKEGLSVGSRIVDINDGRKGTIIRKPKKTVDGEMVMIKWDDGSKDERNVDYISAPMSKEEEEEYDKDNPIQSTTSSYVSKKCPKCGSDAIVYRDGKISCTNANCNYDERSEKSERKIKEDKSIQDKFFDYLEKEYRGSSGPEEALALFTKKYKISDKNYQYLLNGIKRSRDEENESIKEDKSITTLKDLLGLND